MRVAFSTKNGDRVDAHFGWAPYISIYEVEADSYEFLEKIEFEKNLDEDGNEDKLTPKIKALSGCAVLYVSAIGGSAAAKVVSSKIHPIKVTNEENIIELIERMQGVLRGTPPPWLRKVMRRDDDLEKELENE